MKINHQLFLLCCCILLLLSLDPCSSDEDAQQRIIKKKIKNRKIPREAGNNNKQRQTQSGTSGITDQATTFSKVEPVAPTTHSQQQSKKKTDKNGGHRFGGDSAEDGNERGSNGGAGGMGPNKGRGSSQGSSQGNAPRKANTDGTPGGPCPPCLARKNKLKEALHWFWRGRLRHAYACACHVASTDKADLSSRAMAESILYALQQSKYALALQEEFPLLSSPLSPPKVDPPYGIEQWEVLGPFPVSKLEVDGDPAFQTYDDGNDGGNGNDGPKDGRKDDFNGDGEGEGEGHGMLLPSGENAMPGSDRFDPALHILSQVRP